MVWPWRRKARRTMARIAIEGPIAGATRQRVLKALRQVEERECPALLLRIDSPGGTVGDSQEIHAAIRRLRDKGCRVVASFGNISASGGVYVGVAAESIVANPGTITGSIGVILRGNNLSRLLERIGIQFETVKSGLYKDILSPDRALTEPERQLLQELIDSSYGQFVAAVAEGRGLSEEVVRSFADGRVFTGAQALALGLVDALGDEEVARIKAAELADLDPQKTRPITFGKPPKGLASLIPGRALLQRLGELVSLELAWSGQPLWLYRP
ncbi:signal peptide peptidase SppA [Synechococcus sp. CS-1328]|uniref:signal peptide peptidase SppA n=1 Tax=Synechococcus sp. CS-1328 TaxID=2847976 RepID=UPI00223A7A8A|nr:signal peptide peptidase SppA [Synechococcus sp. CS-1328]MCT0225797.1 signal peptide peptidase SppA [Synechococcus sp. CS-1328]MCT0225804.1 signal peptide peptidase SppA [Synechococcus sp. CS-1328]